MLLTNLVLVGWVVASGRPAGPRDAPARGPAPRRRVHDLRPLLVAGLVGSAAIHAAVVPEHLTEWAAAGSFFVVLTLAELALGTACSSGSPAVLGRRGRGLGRPLVLWLVSRTVGLPFGPEPWHPRRWDSPTSAAACSSW